MSYVFFVSSAGDTNLALKTIDNLRERDNEVTIFLQPLTAVANDKIKLISSPPFELLIPGLDFSGFRFDDKHIGTIKQIMTQKKITQAFVGVPSPLTEKFAYQLAAVLEMNTVVAYEYLFNAPDHAFWGHIKDMHRNPNLRFAVPLKAAAQAVQEKADDARLDIIGHLSMDNALISATSEAAVSSPKVKDVELCAKLQLKSDESMVFASGTTQPQDVDVNFVRAIIEELNSGDHSNVQVRFGIHPGVFKRNFDDYLSQLVQVCADYPGIDKQFRTSAMEYVKNKVLLDNPVFIKENISGAELAQCADGVSQAVPGFFPNEAAIQGKSVYYHQAVKSYLPPGRFSDSITTFFNSLPKPTQPPLKAVDLELDATDTATRLATLLSS